MEESISAAAQRLALALVTAIFTRLFKIELGRAEVDEIDILCLIKLKDNSLDTKMIRVWEKNPVYKDPLCGEVDVEKGSITIFHMSKIGREELAGQDWDCNVPEVEELGAEEHMFMCFIREYIRVWKLHQMESKKEALRFHVPPPSMVQ